MEEIALYTDIEQYDKDADAVVMMTMHAAKGLEFPNVFVVGCEEDLFPSARCVGDPDEMEEERRLCYVAITRAKRHLTLTSARQRMLYGHTTANRPSRFLRRSRRSCCWKKAAARPSYAAAKAAPPKPRHTFQTYIPQQRAASALPSYQKGEMVQHDAFGTGMILSVMPTGNDAMLEIAFDQVGTKHLMAKGRLAADEKTLSAGDDLKWIRRN